MGLGDKVVERWISPRTHTPSVKRRRMAELIASASSPTE